MREKTTDQLYGNEKELCAFVPNVILRTMTSWISRMNVVELHICSTCGRMRKSGEWIEEYTLQEQLGARFQKFAEDDVEMELQYWEENQKMFVRVHAKKAR